MARRKRKNRVIKSSRVRKAQHAFASAVDKCIASVSSAKAGRRMKELGACVRRELKK